jgi:division protein CdvB (Snf7/Vps24/ESCRT-III family)
VGSRHLVDHEHQCPGCGELHVIVIDLAPVLQDLENVKEKLEDVETIKAIVRRIDRHVGEVMTKLTDLRDEVKGLFDDIAAKIQRLQDAIDNPNNTETRFSAEDQAAFDELKATVDAARATVGDENADGTPVA